MTDFPGDLPNDLPREAIVTVGILLPVIWDFEYLPYFPAHMAFMDHAEPDHCAQCHAGAFHQETVPSEAEEQDLFCDEGQDLREAVRLAIKDQFSQALRN